jgi:hypothetical protein
MITLSNGCTCSKLSVYPENWQSKIAKVTIDWYIMYRFYDPEIPQARTSNGESNESTQKALRTSARH